MNRDQNLRWVIYRDEGDAFFRVGSRNGGSAKDALANYIEDHPDQEIGQRFAVRRSTVVGELFIIQLQEPKPEPRPKFDLVQV